MKRSQTIRKKGPEVDPLLLGSGWSPEDLPKAQVLLETATADHPGSKHLDKLVESAREQIYASGGKPSIFTTSDICDGIATGHEGMNYSLVSRDIIAAMVEIHGRAMPFDAVITFSSCDKAIPAHLMALAELNLPAIQFSGGSMMPGPGFISAEKCYHTAGLVKSGQLSKEKELFYKKNACPTNGACQYMGTASTMQVISEALGLSLPGTALMPSWSNLITFQAKKAARQVLQLLADNITTQDILTKEAFLNAIKVHAAVAGSTNAIIHLPAIAKQAGITITLDDFDRIHKSIPVLTNCKTAGPWPTQLFWYAGGVPQIMLNIKEELNLDTLTVTGKTLGENLKELEDQNFFEETNSYLINYKLKAEEIIQTADNPISKTGGLAVLKGNLAPEGSVVKHSSVANEMQQHIGPARPFNSEEAAIEAIRSGKILPGDIIIIRYKGPGGSGMPEMLKTTEELHNNPELKSSTALITDGRFSGATRGPAIGHVSPEAINQGPIAYIHENDLIEIDIPARKLNLIGVNKKRLDLAKINKILDRRSQEEIILNQKNKSSGILKLYQKNASDLASGATLF